MNITKKINNEELFEMLMEIRSKVDRCLQPVTQNVWLTTKEAAKALKVTTRTLQTYRDQGLIPFSQIGREVRFNPDDIQEFLMRHYVRSINQKGVAA